MGAVHLGTITIFPIKSLEGVVVSERRITPRGFLEGDRIYALVDAAGKYVNGKRDARVHRLRCAFDEGISEVRLRSDSDGAGGQFSLAEPAPLDRWLSEYFAQPVFLRHEPEAGFPDDREAFGPTVVSEPSLRAVADWFPGLTLESARWRFRSNLELAGEDLAPFWEDGLYGAAGELKPFWIGPVRLRGHNPCQRCVVPTRDQRSGEPIAGFQKQFMERRRQSLPPWANAARFNHYYRFAVNTSIEPSEAGKTLHTGDTLALPVPEMAV